MHAPAPPPRAFRGVTAILVALNVGVYLFQVACGVPWVQPSTAQLLAWGGNLPVFTLTGDSWRLATSLFLHAGIVHLALNMYVLGLTGPQAQRQFGAARLLAIYLGGGLLASCASTAWADHHAFTLDVLGRPVHRLSVGVGASGAVMALFGALLAAAALRVPEAGAARRHAGFDRSLLKVVALNLVLGFLVPGVDQAAHVGGLAGGFAIGLVMAWPAARPAAVARYAATAALVGAGLGGLLGGPPRPDLEQLRAQLLEQAPPEAAAADGEGDDAGTDADAAPRARAAPAPPAPARRRLPPGTTEL